MKPGRVHRRAGLLGGDWVGHVGIAYTQDGALVRSCARIHHASPSQSGVLELNSCEPYPRALPFP